MDNRDFAGDEGYHAFRDTYWHEVIGTALSIDCYIHETRHTCASMLEAKEVSQTKINKILGHTGKTVAENVYTHLDVTDLLEAINMI